MQKHVPSHVFRQYDIRGHAEQDLSPALFYAIGSVLGKKALEKNPLASLALGHDARSHSLGFAKALLAGLKEAGCEVHWLGLATTPLVYWSEYKFNLDGALMVTGSHTGAEKNGLKISLSKAPFYGKDLQTLMKSVEFFFKNSFSEHFSDIVSTQPNVSLLHRSSKKEAENYVCDLTNRFEWNQDTHVLPLKVVWDFGGAAPALLVDLIKTHVPGVHLFLNQTLSFTPPRPLDPGAPDALTHLQETVRQEKAQVGFAFDGDGDRLVVVDDTGRIWAGDETLVFFATFQKKDPSPVVVDIKSSPFLLSELEKKRPVCWSPTGHVHLKTLMSTKRAHLGGEVSGHFFFKDTYWGFDDGFYAALRLLHLLCRKQIHLSSWYALLPVRCSSPEWRIPLLKNQQQEVLDALYKEGKKANAQCMTLDGLKIMTDTDWLIARSSQTEDCLSLRFEALDQKSFTHMAQKIIQVFSKLKLKPPINLNLC